jgi:carbamate kinase
VVAFETGADMLIMLTDIDAVYADYKGRTSRPLLRTGITGSNRPLDDGPSHPGSMGPRVQAPIGFVQCRRGPVLITNEEGLSRSLSGRRGMIMVKER